MRIVVDVSPLSHRRTGIGNYIRGSLAGVAEVAGGEHELVAFAPASPAGRREIESSLADVSVERRLPTMPFAHAVRFFVAAFYDASPWSRLWRESLWLVGLGLAFGAGARLAMRRLLA